MIARSAARYHGLETSHSRHLGLTPQALCLRLLRRLMTAHRWNSALQRATFLICFYLFLAPPGAAAVRAIWAVNDGEKIERDDLNNPNKSANSAWDGKKIKIFGAHNEIVAFQLIV